MTILYRGGQNPKPRRTHKLFGRDLALCGKTPRNPAWLTREDTEVDCARCKEITRRLDGRKMWLY